MALTVMHTIHGNFVSVNSVTDTEVLDAFLEALPAETQEASAARVEVDRSQFSRWRKARRAGEDVVLHGATRARMERATRDLTSDDPVARAARAAYLRAAEEAESMAARFRELAATTRRPDLSEEDAIHAHRATEGQDGGSGHGRGTRRKAKGGGGA